MGAGNSARLWRNEAAAVARRVNTGWWLARFNLLLAVGLILFAVAVLCLRTLIPDWMETFGPFVILGGLVAGTALWAFFWSKGRFIGRDDALVRLDDRLNLNNQLSAANREVGDWPEHRASKSDEIGLKWRWEVAILPGMLAGLMVVVAWFVPVLDLKGKEELVTHEPNGWGQMEEWLTTLEEEELIDPDSIEEIEDKIEELRDQPEEGWFGHASLEATDTLKESLGRDIQDLSKDLGTIERDLEALRSFSTELSEAGKEMLLREMEDAMKNLAMNGMEINSELAKQLGQIDPSQVSQEMMKNLTAEQMQQLQEGLGQKREALGSMDGLPPMAEGGLWSSSLGLGRGLQPGQGSISRGRGDAPLFFGDEEDLRTNNIEKVTNEDLSRPSMGDLLGVGETEHEEGKESSSPKAGGAVTSQGRGGDAVWRESLVPEEQALLKRYFKTES